MTNAEIIAGIKLLHNISGELNTYKEWQRNGYQVQKGEKAFTKTKLWQQTTKKDKDTGKAKSYFILVNAALFTENQVKPGKSEATGAPTRHANKQPHAIPLPQKPGPTDQGKGRPKKPGLLPEYYI